MTAQLKGLRIVCFYPWDPFEPSGAWTRFVCLCRYLLAEGAEVTMAFIYKGTDVRLKNLSVRYSGDLNALHRSVRELQQVITKAGARLEELRKFTPEELMFMLMYEPELYRCNPKNDVWLEEIIATHDLVTCEYTMYVPLLSEPCRKAGKPLIVSCLDLLYELHATTPRAKEKLKERELRALGLADARFYVSDSERQQMAAHGLDGTTVISTGDALAIEPGDEPASREAVRAALRMRTPHYCLFVGSRHGPNQEAVEEIRRLAKLMPEMSFVVAGNCSNPISEGNFFATGRVSDRTLDRLYRGALIVIVPLRRGTGNSLKFFEALNYAKPVVSTAVGARAFAVADGRELLLAPLEQFPVAIRRLAADAALRDRLSAEARRYASALDFRQLFRSYGETILRLLQRPAAKTSVEPPALILADNNLKDRIGHHFNYALSLRAECQAQGVPFLALGRLGMEPAVGAALGLCESFSVGIHEECADNPYPPEWGGLRATFDLLLSNATFARELGAALQNRARPGDTVFLPNATPRQMLGLALLLHRQPVFRSMRYVLMLRYTTQLAYGPLSARKMVLDKDSAGHYQLAIDRLAEAAPLGAVRITTDSVELAKEYQLLTKFPVEVLPIPHTQHAAPASWPADVPARTPGKVRIVYLGDARDEKGFELLPSLVRTIAGQPATAAVEFVFQAYISSSYHQPMAACIEELERLSAPNLHLVKSALDAGSYLALLQSADLVLLPYDAVTYRARTSGPFVEAICLGKPVVVPRDSWMSGQLGASGAGRTFVSGYAADLAGAVAAAVMQLPALTKAAGELGARFRSYHNPTRFVGALMQQATAGDEATSSDKRCVA